MKRSWLAFWLALTCIALILLAVSPTAANDGNRVAVVVDFGNGQVATKCVSFTEDSITGFDALQRSGLPVETDFQTGGAAVCRIDGQGCPSDDCFCECRGGDECKYWSYWHFSNGTWNYSVAGASIYQVRDGAVDGWVWGLGSITQASPPPAIPFKDICTDGILASPTATSTRPPTSTPLILPTLAPTEIGPSTTPTTVLVTATVPATSEGSLVTPTIEIENPTPPFVAGVQTETPDPQGSMGESGVAAMTTAPPAPEIDLNSNQLASEEPILLPTSPVEIVQQPANTGDNNGLVLDSTPEAIDELGVVGSPLGDLPLASTSIPTATPIVVSAIVGMDVAVDQSRTIDFSEQADESANWGPYAGFAALLLILISLALLVYRRRGRLVSKVLP